MITLIKAFEYKKYTVTILSISLSSILTLLEHILNLEFFGISYSFLMLAVTLIIIDFFTGAIASRHENKIQKNDRWFKSSSLSYTVYKFLSIFLILWLTDEVHNNLEYLVATTEKGFKRSFYISSNSFISFARATAFFLICGREFVSIGENIDRRFGKKPYIFEFFGKVLDIIEIKFIKRIQETEYCDNTDDKNKPDQED